MSEKNARGDRAADEPVEAREAAKPVEEPRFHVDEIRANAAGLARELGVSPDLIAGALRTADRDRRQFTRREIEQLVREYGKREV